MRRILACSLAGAVLVMVAAGCGSSRSILYSGVSLGSSGKKRVISDTAASADARRQLAQWVADIAHRGRADPSQRFANLTTRRFRRRLAAAASRYDFTVKRVRFYRPRQLAPLVIVQTRHYLALARAIPAIERSLNPDLTGWAFEGFFLEAQDERGVPFITVSDALRGPGGGGGQWARSDRLFPFAHG
jgi:hypothetical protein